jgi:hypothetical protein
MAMLMMLILVLLKQSVVERESVLFVMTAAMKKPNVVRQNPVKSKLLPWLKRQIVSVSLVSR